jgi:hypothetical protein
MPLSVLSGKVSMLDGDVDPLGHAR